jgi:hypothetical protein
MPAKIIPSADIPLLGCKPRRGRCDLEAIEKLASTHVHRGQDADLKVWRGRLPGGVHLDPVGHVYAVWADVCSGHRGLATCRSSETAGLGVPGVGAS